MKLDVDNLDGEVALAELSPIEQTIQDLGRIEAAIRRLKDDPSRASELRERVGNVIAVMQTLSLDAAVVPLERLQVALKDLADGVIPPMAMVLDDLRGAVTHAARLVGSAWASAAQLATVLVIERDEVVAPFARRAVGYGRVIVARALNEVVDMLDGLRVQAVIIGHVGVPASELFAWVPVIRARARRSPVAMVDDQLSLDERIQAIHSGVTRLLPPPDDTNVFVGVLREICIELPQNTSSALVYTEHAGFARELISVLHVAGITAAHRDSADRIFAELDAMRPEAVVVGPRIGGTAGLDVLRVIRASGRWRDLPVVYLAGTQHAEERVRAYNAGADACFHHPISVDEMTARLRNVLHRARQRASLASLDPLTGLIARHAFIDQATHRSHQAERWSVALIELDGARLMTTQHGFAFVDEATVRLAQLLRGTLEPTDLVGRWSSRRLVAAVFGHGAEAVSMAMAKLNDDLGQEALRTADGRAVTVTISVGVAEVADGNVDAALRIADTRLRIASGFGGGRVEAS